MSHIIIYADDTVLSSPSPAVLQKLIDIAAECINERELEINMKKTKCMAINLNVTQLYMYPLLYSFGRVSR